MPKKNYKYSKEQGTFVKDSGEQAIDYNSMELYDADSWGLLISYWRQYPDRLLDLLESENPPYTLEPIQRMIIRVFFRSEHAFVTGSRGFTKSVCCLVAKLLLGILYPRTIMRYAAPTMEQMADIAHEKWEAIKQQWKGLTDYWEVVSLAQTGFEIRTKEGSVITISVERGNDCNSICAEEVAQEESGKQFDFDRFANAVLPTARVERMVNRESDPFFPQFQKQYITSAGNQQNPSFQYRNDTYREMLEGRNSICLDIPWVVPVLSGIRRADYYADLRSKQTPEAQLRELESIWTGTSENPVIRDSTLTESKLLATMEARHCGDPNVFYIVGYDVSYADGVNNAKCAIAVVKCERQSGEYKQDRFLKSLVYVKDEPPKDHVQQAKHLKSVWYRFCIEGGAGTFLAIDSWQYGTAVVQALHSDLGDGLPPLCCVNHEFPELEQKGALPVIYPIKAVGGFGSGTHDNDGEMIRYAEMEFEHRNVQLLVANLYEGIRAYKVKHHIKDDTLDPTIAVPYVKTRELCGQIANLQKKVTGMSLSEKRISNHIQRDMWSAFKYALRYAQILEQTVLVRSTKKESEWTAFLNNPYRTVGDTSAPKSNNPQLPYGFKPRIQAGWRTGGNRIV